MKKNIIILLVLIGNSGAIGQSAIDNVLSWQERKITWNDFRGPAPQKSPYGSELSYKISIETKNIGIDSVILYVNTLMVLNTSWTITDSSWQLNHEQKHFDLVEVYSRKLRKACAEKKFMKSQLLIGLKKLYDEHKMNTLLQQRRYDRETNHSLISDVQVKWDKEIERELSALEAYSGNAVPLRVDFSR